MDSAEIDKLKLLLRTPTSPELRVAFRSPTDGKFYEVTGSSDNGFTTRGFHFVSFSKVKPSDFELLHIDFITGNLTRDITCE
jgi:hypothetical protein